MIYSNSTPAPRDYTYLNIPPWLQTPDMSPLPSGTPWMSRPIPKPLPPTRLQQLQRSQSLAVRVTICPMTSRYVLRHMEDLAHIERWKLTKSHSSEAPSPKAPLTSECNSCAKCTLFCKSNTIHKRRPKRMGSKRNPRTNPHLELFNSSSQRSSARSPSSTTPTAPGSSPTSG